MSFEQRIEQNVVYRGGEVFLRGRKCYKNIACTQILSSFKYNNDINNNNKSCIDVYEGLTTFPCAGVSSQDLGTRFLFFLRGTSLPLRHYERDEPGGGGGGPDGGGGGGAKSNGFLPEPIVDLAPDPEAPASPSNPGSGTRRSLY